MKDWAQIKFAVRENVILDQICDEYVLFAIRDAAKYCRHMQTINETAAYFWELLEEENDVQKIIYRASEEFEVDSERIRHDFYTLLDQLERMNYLVLIEEKGEKE